MNEQTRNENVDPAETAKFGGWADDWWDPNGHMKALHAINPVRLDYIKERISLPQKKILDVGCGGGLLSEALAREKAEVTGLDMSDALIQIAKTHAEQQKLEIHYRAQSVESLAETSEKFDIVTCMELLEHVPDPISIIKACAELTQPGGLVFFSTLNRNLKSFALAILGAEYLLRFLPIGTHEYQKFIRPSELTDWARPHRLSLSHLTGIQYNFWQKKFCLSKDVSVNYIACFVKDKNE